MNATSFDNFIQYLTNQTQDVNNAPKAIKGDQLRWIAKADQPS